MLFINTQNGDSSQNNDNLQNNDNNNNISDSDNSNDCNNNSSNNNNSDNNNNANQSKDNEWKKIEDSGSVTANGRHTIHCLTIIGQIEGHGVLPADTKTTKYEHIIPQLVSVEEDPNIEGMLIILNTVGGDVEAGLALAELIAGMSKPTVSLVLGGGHSIGVPLAVSAKCSFIVPSATMTVHPVRSSGLVLGVPQTMDFFGRMQKRITGFVAKNSNVDEDRFTKMMLNTDELTTDMGTVLDGEMAVKCGLIDKLGSLSDAIGELYAMIDKSEKRE